MNEKINADIQSLKFIFSKNKAYIVPVVVIFISIILFFQFVIPQFNAFLVIRKDAQAASSKLAALKANLSLLVNVNDETLDLQLKTLSVALPTKKDYIGILNSIYLTSQKTGVNLGNFSLKIGDISKSDSADKLQVVSLSLPINSSIAAVSSFIDAIGSTLPLVEVNSVKAGNVSSTVNLSFYYKSLDLSKYNQNIHVGPISQNGLIIIDKLNKFNDPNAISRETMIFPIATSSAAK